MFGKCTYWPSQDFKLLLHAQLTSSLVYQNQSSQSVVMGQLLHMYDKCKSVFLAYSRKLSWCAFANFILVQTLLIFASYYFEQLLLHC